MLEQVVRLHPSFFKNTFPDRWVNNIYFDTPDLSCLNDNLSGVSHRMKFRVRWYGEDYKKASNPKLEIKIKENMLGWKDTAEVSDFELDDIGLLREELEQKQHSFARLEPKLLNRYLRSYYESADRKFRLTIDRDMQYFSFLSSNHFNGFPYKEQGVILELKYDEEHEEASEFVRQHIPLRQSKSSKYVTGLALFV